MSKRSFLYFPHPPLRRKRRKRSNRSTVRAAKRFQLDKRSITTRTDRTAFSSNPCRPLSSMMETLYLIRCSITFSRRFTTASPEQSQRLEGLDKDKRTRTCVNHRIYQLFHVLSAVETREQGHDNLIIPHVRHPELFKQFRLRSEEIDCC